jgi:hypothetical protein
MSKLFHTLSDNLYSIKEKLSDQEFIDIMNILSTFKSEEEKGKKYKITFLYPDIISTVDTCHCHPYNYNGSSHEIRLIKRSFITKLIDCKDKDEKCSSCIINSECYYIKRFLNCINENSNRNIPIHYLTTICDKECKELLMDLSRNITFKSHVHNISVLEESSSSDNDEDEEDEEKIHSFNRKKVICNNIQFEINIYIDSIEEI